MAEHVELSLTKVLQRIDDEIGRANDELEHEVTGAEGRLAQAEARHAEVLARRERRREELGRQQAVTLQGVERLASALILPHPERDTLDVRRLRPHPETEMTDNRIVIEHEAARGCQVYGVHEKNLGYDVTSLDLESGELRLIEVKGLAGPTGSILLTPIEGRVAEDPRDCYWLYVVTDCATAPTLQDPISDPAPFPWHEVTKVAHYYLSVNALRKPMQVREDGVSYGQGATRYEASEGRAILASRAVRLHFPRSRRHFFRRQTIGAPFVTVMTAGYSLIGRYIEGLAQSGEDRVEYRSKFLPRFPSIPRSEERAATDRIQHAPIRR